MAFGILVKIPIFKVTVPQPILRNNRRSLVRFVSTEKRRGRWTTQSDLAEAMRRNRVVVDDRPRASGIHTVLLEIMDR
jgi:hypothetical protein